MDQASVDQVDVLIVGAGLSGIGAACHLRQRCPGKTYTILEARDAIGGTWDLFRYPGIRSDSDMFTMGYSFRPWRAEKSIADGDTIRDYVRDTAREYGVERHIRFHHRVITAEWSSDSAQWTVTAENGDGLVTVACSFLFVCSGYYRYDEGYAPTFAGSEQYRGRIVHPQHWPEDLDYTGQRVVIIGSGATAVTLVPAMAERAAHVTMVQRSPTYIVAMPARDRVADALRRRLSEKRAYSLTRFKNITLGLLSFKLTRRAPRFMTNVIRKQAAAHLPEGYDVAKHFTPRYNPWDQRVCLVPDADLFQAIKRGAASIVTDEIETFTPDGIRLASGVELPADLIVTATGLNLLAIGGIRLTVDGRAVDIANTVAYKGMMVSGVPNFAFTLGYTNASWTLRADLVAEYVCRLLRHLDAHGYEAATPLAPGPTTELAPLINLTSGYVTRSADALPKQGAAAPWRMYQNYARDVLRMRRGSVSDKGIRFTRAKARIRIS